MNPSRLAVGISIAVLTSAGGSALAYWSSTGFGTGSASTGTSNAVTLLPGVPAKTLYPGGRTAVVLTVTNPNSTPVSLTAIALDTGQGHAGFAVDAAHTGCDTSSLSFTTQTSTGWTVPARTGSSEGTLPVTLTSAMGMAANAANACQDATFTVFLKAS